MRKTILALSLAAFGLCPDAQAETLNQWTGAVNCSWKEKGNWSRGTVPSSTEIAVFAVDDSLKVTNGSPAVGGIRLTGGNLTLNVSSVTVYGSGGVTGTVDVATGAKLLVNATLDVATKDEVVEKLGGGTLIVNAKIGNSRNLELVISGGSVLAGGAGGATDYYKAVRTRIRTGGVLGPYLMSDGADKDKHSALKSLKTLILEADGAFDCRSKDISMTRALSGAGEIRNACGTFLCATNFTGRIVSSGGSMTFGNGTEADDFVFAGVKEIVLPTASTPSVYFKNAKPQRVTTPIVGNARVYVYNSCVDFANIDLVASQGDIYNSFVVSGGRMTSGKIYFKSSGLSLTVTNGASVSASYVSVANRNPGTRLLQPDGVLLEGSPTLRAETGGELTFYSSWATRMEAACGGILRFGRRQTSGSTVLLDGGIYLQQADAYAYIGFGDEKGAGNGCLEVGARGGRFEQQSTVASSQCQLGCTVAPASGVSADGGLSFAGYVTYFHYKPFGLTGPIALQGGTMSVLNTTDNAASKTTLLGTGDLILGNADMTVASALSPVAFAQGSGSRLRLAGSARLNLPVGATQLLTFGDPTASGSTLLRDRGGLLTLRHDGDEMLYGETTQVKVSGGVTVDPQTGLVKVPVFAESKIDVAANKKSVWARRFYFTGYDAEKGFYAVTNMAGALADDATKVVRVASATLAADTTNRVAGLCVIGNSSTAWDPTSSGASLTLSQGSVLKVGNGVDPAGVLMCSDGDLTVAAVKGAGTLDFGTSEGIVLINRRSPPVCLLARIAGSNGVTFATPAEESGSVYLGENDYAGGTWISGTVVRPRASTSFGTGAVRTGLGNGTSGGIWIGLDGLQFTNRLYLAGYGINRSSAGALYFGATSVWSGDIDLVEPARICVYGPSSVATLSGTVAGDRLQLFLSNASTNELGVLQNGTLRMTAANSYTGGTEIVRSRLALAGSGTLGTGKVTLDRGILRLENGRDEKSIPNLILGVGTVELTGRGQVNFTGGVDTRAREGTSVTLDVQSSRAKIGSLDGFSSVTAPAGKSVTLNVIDTTPFAGSVASNVTLVYGSQPKSGIVLIVR